MYRILLVGGGSAGHVEPALAVASWLLENSSDISCEFVGTRSGIENELVPFAGLKLHHILKAPLPRNFGVSALLWPFRFLIATGQSLRTIRSADLVIGFGGYVCAPAYLAAKISSTPFFLHEANAIPGWANTFGARFAKKSMIAFESTKLTGDRWKRADLVGMPIRREIFAIRSMSKSERAKIWEATYRNLGLDRSKRTIFIFGGSLGAASLNKVLEEALPELLKLNLNVIHGVGRQNKLPKSQPGYLPLPYISNMADLYISSDLIIARGGAVTCAELDAANSFALVVPLAIGNGEQVANAADLVAKGAGEICKNSEFSSIWLLANIERLISTAIDWNLARNQIVTISATEKIGKLVLAELGRKLR